jgi:hypothetical protein
VRINDICVSLKQKTPFCDPYRFQRNGLVESFVPKFLELCEKSGHPIYLGMHIHVLPFLANHFARVFHFETDHQSDKDPYAQQVSGQDVPTWLQQQLCALDSTSLPDESSHPANQAFIQFRKENHLEPTRESVLADLYQKLSRYLGRPLCDKTFLEINNEILGERLKNLCGGSKETEDKEIKEAKQYFDDRSEYFPSNEKGTEYWLSPQLLVDLPYFVTLHLKDLGYLKES